MIIIDSRKNQVPLSKRQKLAPHTSGILISKDVSTGKKYYTNIFIKNSVLV
jgi:hypothetical protein